MLVRFETRSYFVNRTKTFIVMSDIFRAISKVLQGSVQRRRMEMFLVSSGETVSRLRLADNLKV